MAATTSSWFSQLTGKLAGVDRCQLSARPVYLLDFHIYKPSDEWAVTWRELQQICVNQFCHPEESVRNFCYKISHNCGVNLEGRYLPPGITKAKDAETPIDKSINAARQEAEEVMFTCVRELLKAQKVDPKEIDMLVCNCSLFNTVPSLSAMIINHFKMRSDIIVYNLGGMGCSAGLISISMVNELLQVHPGCRALVVSTENITQNYYTGTNRSMFIPNALFKVGGAAILLSNRRADVRRAKYQLQHTVRVHMGAKDEAYACVYQQQDSEGNTGVKLDKSLMKIAGHALKKNIEVLGSLALPISEQIKYVVDKVKRKLFKNCKNDPAYVPNFKTTFQHYCIHAGGRGVLDAMQENLKLTDDMIRPSRTTLYYFGNTSSSSIWYELGWMESNGLISRGESVWQIAFGSGFKCNSVVWKALKKNDMLHPAWTLEGGKALLKKRWNQTCVEKTKKDDDYIYADAPMGYKNDHSSFEKNKSMKTLIHRKLFEVHACKEQSRYKEAPTEMYPLLNKVHL